ncbi:YdeI/OmpD-associated family protein [Kiloniella laminariae]|uniref:YdeI/OmpD-associated family protein n=1 Tax=Kiloniella laminariae TaxID=454162 RepID=A0ABT4LEX6_9PROT|nr:DUF1801 domain-containing protein [Kiloniella laminariae]MCZ4279648.1 YdeI/OmpD-associated family protein [Kiloniella laminariae]
MNMVNPKVDALLQSPKWQEERKALRTIVLDCDLVENVKWGKLCYTFQKNNVVMIFALKDHCTLGFLKGSLLKDRDALLIRPGENSQAMRWFKFTSVQEITEKQAILKAYIHEAIELEKSGQEVDFKEKNELVFPEEFQTRLEENPALKKAFTALTPGRQRAYNLHFSGAKQSRTRMARIEKSIPAILDGKGLNDR